MTAKDKFDILAGQIYSNLILEYIRQATVHISMETIPHPALENLAEKAYNFAEALVSEGEERN